MTKDKSLHLTPKQLGLEDNPMIKGGALDSDSGEPGNVISVVYLREIDAGTDNACWVVCSRIDPGAVRFESVE